MERFTTEFRALHETDDADRIEATLAGLEREQFTEMDGTTFSPVSKVPSKLFDLLQVGLRRIIELTESSVREMNRGKVVTAYVLVRAVLETSCLLLDATRRAQKAVKNGDAKAVDEIDKFLMDVLVGFKSPEWGFSEEYVARNVLTIIQRLTKELDLELMWFYEGLSEVAHPNYLGMLGMYQKSPTTPGDTLVKYGAPQGEDLKVHMQMAIGGLATATEMMALAIKNFDEIATPFALLCEQEIYEGGTWPEGMEYPLKRRTS
ncbi:MAG: hypothetical protein AB7L71_00050 [Vicinamibacterales bacterium]